MFDKLSLNLQPYVNPTTPQQSPIIGGWLGDKLKEGASQTTEYIGEKIKDGFVYLWINSLPYVRWICTIAAIMGLLAALYGWKKGKYVSGCSISLFVFVKMLNFLFRG